VLRCGGWDISEYYVRAAYRYGGAPDGRFAGFGFRCVSAAPGE